MKYFWGRPLEHRPDSYGQLRRALEILRAIDWAKQIYLSPEVYGRMGNKAAIYEQAFAEKFHEFASRRRRNWYRYAKQNQDVASLARRPNISRLQNPISSIIDYFPDRFDELFQAILKHDLHSQLKFLVHWHDSFADDNLPSPLEIERVVDELPTCFPSQRFFGIVDPLSLVVLSGPDERIESLLSHQAFADIGKTMSNCLGEGYSYQAAVLEAAYFLIDAGSSISVLEITLDQCAHGRKQFRAEINEHLGANNSSPPASHRKIAWRILVICRKAIRGKENYLELMRKRSSLRMAWAIAVSSMRDELNELLVATELSDFLAKKLKPVALMSF
ncbi:hypothetical protein [Propionivibrio dicarboxylicus]|nr:hypothetical protein [Propionivibrio dicarboxylicus]